MRSPLLTPHARAAAESTGAALELPVGVGAPRQIRFLGELGQRLRDALTSQTFLGP